MERKVKILMVCHGIFYCSGILFIRGLYGICKSSSCMCPAVCVCHSRQFFIQQMILLQTVRDQNSFVVPVKLHRLFMIPAFLVFVDHHRTFLIELLGTVHPHIAFTVRTVTVTDHLCRGFVRLCHRQGQQFLLHA